MVWDVRPKAMRYEIRWHPYYEKPAKDERRIIHKKLRAKVREECARMRYGKGSKVKGE